MMTKVTEEEKAKIKRYIDEMFIETLKGTECLLKMSIEAELDHSERLERIREAMIRECEDDPEQQDRFKNMDPERLFNRLYAANKKAKQLKN